MNSRSKFAILLVGLFAALFIVSMISKFTDDDNATLDVLPAEKAVSLSEAQAKMLADTLGITADTPADTLRTLAVTINSQKAENQQLKQELERLKGQFEQGFQSNIDTMQQKFSLGLAQTQSSFERQLAELKARTHEIGVDAPVLPEYADFDKHSYNNSYDELGLGNGGISATGSSTQASVIWVNPLDSTVDEKTGQMMTPALLRQQRASEATRNASDDFDADEPEPTPVYTLVRGSVLSDSVALTALMGRIPINGQVTSPYPFSAMIGVDNLMANGFTLPGVTGAIVTGTVTGDWTLSCVRGVVETFDFIMQDGSVISIPDDTPDTEFDGMDIKTQDLGYLADPNGNPCISGLKITNAPGYLTTMGLLDAAAAAANAAAAAQTTISIDAGGDGTSNVTGDATQYALANAAAGSVSNVNSWIKERMGSSFDVVYAEPGTPIAIHLRQNIDIDLPVNGRLTHYNTRTTGGTYVLD